MTKYPRKWEIIRHGSYRLKVPGGWLVSSEIFETEYPATSVCFFPDPENLWELEDENKS